VPRLVEFGNMEVDGKRLDAIFCFDAALDRICATRL
jgi:hypothetical protein